MEEEEKMVAAAAGEEWQGVAQKRKAWAKSRDSWQASEAERLSPEPADLAAEQELCGAKLPLTAEGGAIPNEKIAIWLKDCRTPLGASLDEQSNPALKGMLVRNGGSFEDDLSLGAEANQLHQSIEQMEICNSILAKDKRLQFHQRGRSMNSTGSGKSSATVSSVSELLELYEEDPEEVLYNLGFGRDEPDIASKIPSRFFNSSSFARGIDIKVFLSAQLQRMEVENPNFALTSRFRQIEVLTTVANAFSSLYSQVSGTPLQKIGSMNSVSSSKEASSPPPLTRSNTANRLMKTLSKLNLYGNPQAGDSGSSISTDKGKSENGSEEPEVKNEVKTPKHFKASLLATVKEEAPCNLSSLLGALDSSELCPGTSVRQETQGYSVSYEDQQNNNSVGHTSGFHEKIAAMNSSNLMGDTLESTSSEHKDTRAIQMPATSVGDKEASVPLTIPSIASLMLQQKDSFEMEEIQSTEGEIPHAPNASQRALNRTKKDQLLRSASQHSDSSGFAEDSSTDCFLLNQLQGHDSLQAMGSSADSCDSENTVTSYSEELKTPVAEPEGCFSELDEENFLLEMKKEEEVSVVNVRGGQDRLECQDGLSSNGKKDEFDGGGLERRNEVASVREAESEALDESSEESDVDKSSECEFLPYKTHHVLKSMSSLESSCSSPSSVERVNIALQRAQRKDSTSSSPRTDRPLLRSKDLLFKKRHHVSELGYPLRRSQSLPTTLLNPVRVVSSVNLQLNPGKQMLCGPPSFTYLYDTQDDPGKENTPEETSFGDVDKSSAPLCKSTLHIAPSPMRKEPSQPVGNKGPDENRSRIQSCPLHLPPCMSQSSCSLHSLHSDLPDRQFQGQTRTFSTHSIPSTPGSSCGGLLSPFGCPHMLRHVGHPHGFHSPNPPSTVEMQLRRVLHEIRNSLQNLSQNTTMRTHDFTGASYGIQRSSILPLYENTFQDLQVVRRNLNLFRTQMMDLELAMLRQQTAVYQHMTEEERYEADQLQTLRKSVRMELQELEMQLEERLLALEEQLRSMHESPPYRQQTFMGMYGSRSIDNLSCPSPLNVMEPVSELIREQSSLKSELGLGLGESGMHTPPPEGSESTFEHCAHSDSSSVCSSQASRKAHGRSSERCRPPSQKVYRASVALMPSPPARAGTGQEEPWTATSTAEQKLEKLPSGPTTQEVPKSAENEELQQVIREIKESIVGEIRREIVSGLLAAVSAPGLSANSKQETQP
ncbi:protein ITPRID2 isoform X1 [Ahaetulla prasina]|uniref:protein ITPRID2 isoform X1 n=1 Tax=Ahaetulla prasina TaxID=499056 RepID=UPI0026477B3C|nr:protein ITPRID2 isoform X1 [Ahaetulla prasina]